MAEQQQQYQALQSLHRELESMEAYEKKDYLTAQSQVPHLVATESDPLRFLRYTNNNPQTAAQGLVRYWKGRCEIFRERAFQPMSLSGNGAMARTDVEFLTTGIAAILNPDQEGRTVVCFDSSRRLDNDFDVRMRCAFWMGQTVSENEASQTLGFVTLIIMSEPKYDSYTAPCMKTFFDLFPIKPHSFHIFPSIPMWEKSPVAHAWVFAAIRIALRLLRHHHVHMHASKKQQLLQEMAEHGFSREDLPACLGGKWSYQNSFRWILERSRQDQIRFMAH